MASAFEVHTASEMVCLAQAGKLRLAQEASARKLIPTERAMSLEIRYPSENRHQNRLY